ncbi:unnamed protein product [Prorocentrum cordatum]|uniref:Uncharacterized protein n=1 Tax=Prorocentrum cordatum TaxID=2364126 RepID=A0ABN9SPL2_9DINO|nr:unnamed protein product [Polarella glacialis]
MAASLGAQGDASLGAALLSVPAAAAPGGPWVLRSAGSLAVSDPWRKPRAPPTPTKQDQKVTFKAVRKQTLHGELGTGNKISSVVQYPISTRDPGNMCAGRLPNHISAEDRRILRVRVKHALRDLRGSEAYASSVYNVEDQLLRGFAKTPEFLNQFYSNEAFADRLLREAASAAVPAPPGVSGTLRGSGSAPSLPTTGTGKVRSYANYTLPGHYLLPEGEVDTREQKVGKAAAKVVARVAERTALATLALPA